MKHKLLKNNLLDRINASASAFIVRFKIKI